MQGTAIARKGIAALLGVAMAFTVGGGLSSSANAADATDAAAATTTTVSSWDGFADAVKNANANGGGTIELTQDIQAEEKGLFGATKLAYQTVTVTSDVTVTTPDKFDRATLKDVHFDVADGGKLTLNNIIVDDDTADNGLSTGLVPEAEIPVTVGSATGSNATSTLVLGANASVSTNNGEGLGAAIVVGSYADVVINGTSDDKNGNNLLATVRGSDAAIITSTQLGEKSDSSAAEAVSAPVTNASITLNSGDIVNENSQSTGSYAINTNGANVTINGGNTQEVRIQNGAFAQTGGLVWPNLDDQYSSILSTNSAAGYDWFGSMKYPLTLGEGAHAYITGGTITGNYTKRELLGGLTGILSEVLLKQALAKLSALLELGAKEGVAVNLESADATVNIRPDSDIVLGGYNSKSNPFTGFVTGEADGTSFAAGKGFAAPAVNANGQQYASAYANLSVDAADNSVENVAALQYATANGDATLQNEASAKSTALANRTFSSANGVRSVSGTYPQAVDGAHWVFATTTFTAPTLVYVNGKASDPASSDPAGTVHLYGPATTQQSDKGLFAGYYDSAFKSAFKSGDNYATSDYKYYVSKDTQNVFVQRSAGNPNNQNRFTIRLLSAMPNSNFKNFVFKVTLSKDGQGSKTFTLYPKTVYQLSNPNGINQPSKSQTPQQFGQSGSDALYWAAGFIQGVPSTWDGATVTVTPAWVTMEQTRVTSTNVSQLPDFNANNEPRTTGTAVSATLPTGNAIYDPATKLQ